MSRFLICYLLPLLLLEISWMPFVASEEQPIPAKQGDVVAESEPTAPVCLDSHDDQEQCSSCQLWLAPSTFREGVWGVFAGSNIDVGSWLGVPEVLVPILDAKLKEYRPWHELIWSSDFLAAHPLYFDSRQQSRMFVPGLGSHVQCRPFAASPVHVELRRQDVAISVGNSVHRSTSPLAGSFTTWHNFTSRLIRKAQEGEELLVDCGQLDDNINDSVDRKLHEFKKDAATCLYQSNSFEVKMTPTSGHGLVTQRSLQQGQIIATSPLLVVDRNQMDQATATSSINNSVVVHGTGMQLLLNYAYGHENSSVLLVPTGIGVNYINHNATSPNAYIRWSKSPLHRHDWIENYSASDLLLEPQPGLLMDFVALRDIEAGEEILIDYGPAWEMAWQDHVKDYLYEQDSSYISAADYLLQLHAKGDGTPVVIRTQSEQLEEPYPKNIQTACYYEYIEGPIVKSVTWSVDNFNCLRPCQIVARETSADGSVYWYTAAMFPVENSHAPDSCWLPPGHVQMVRGVPHFAVTLKDRPYSSDFHWRTAFRHEIGVPDGFFPDAWMVSDADVNKDFQATPLMPGELEPVRRSDTGAQLTTYGYRMGLDAKLRGALLSYADRLGIIEQARLLTIDKHPLPPGSNRTLEVDGLNWYIQRPKAYWASNMHWISPLDEPTHDDFLRVLSAGGFDEMLESIGKFFELDGLVCYHVTFIAVSHCSNGYVHYDFTQTGGKAFNIIIPLILVNGTPPELELWDDNDPEWRGRYRYEYDVAAINGDDSYHATAAVDYRSRKGMRLAATVYVADVNEYNAGPIINDFTQAFPPSDNSQFLLNWAGKHWRRDDPSVRLPQK